MIGGRLVIGVCLTKVHDYTNLQFLQYLHEETCSAGCKMMVFNSYLDFYHKDIYDEGAKAVYGLIDFDIVDALIILGNCFYDKSIIDDLCSRAGEASVPVVILGEERPGCFSVQGDYSESYMNLIYHVLEDHGVKDLFFIAGRKENDPDSVHRLECFMDVMEEVGIPFDESKIAYGEYWNEPTRAIMDNLLADGKRPPEAIFCANDYMAVEVCESLRRYGFEAPQDCIVVGFDGTGLAARVKPHLTTCAENLQEEADKCVELCLKALTKGMSPTKLFVNYKEIRSESCGCPDSRDKQDYEAEAARLYRIVEEIEDHEDFIYSWVDRLMQVTDLKNLKEALRGILQGGSYICVNDTIESEEWNNTESNVISDELVVIESGYSGGNKGTANRILKKNLIMEGEYWAEDMSLYIFNSVYVGNRVCGYMAVKMESPTDELHKIKRSARICNLMFNEFLNRSMQEKVRRNLALSEYMSSMVKLPNAKGASQWFEEFAQIPENHEKTLTVAVYVIPKYSFIYENFGTKEVEEMLGVIAELLTASNRPEAYIAHIAEDEFVILDSYNDPEEISGCISRASDRFAEEINKLNDTNKKDYMLEVNCGYAVLNPGWNDSLESFIKLATGEMYLNRLNSGKAKATKEMTTSKDVYTAFTRLLEKNLFVYHYQPIVDAHTGEIYAYEALMRTTGGVQLSPLQILQTAKEFDRLYEIEHATLNNVMANYASEPHSFGGKKVFINTIPGHFLNRDDSTSLIERYGDIMDNFVYEVTEDDTVSDHELESLKRLCQYGDKSQVAVDDYGTGHSNIVNLLRYEPQIIKIDRYLISEIQNDVNKQMFVKNTIEFARMNHIKVLAEGVETFEEMQKLVEYGVDLFQGYYTARPAPEPLREISSDIKDAIISENIRQARFDSEQRVYHANGGEVLNLVELAINKYSSIQITGGEVELVGDGAHTLEMTVHIQNGATTFLKLRDVNLRSSNNPTIELGKYTNTEMILIGNNVLLKDGIYVPATAKLEITGDGSLSIDTNRNSGIGIGSNFMEPYGDITVNFDGRLEINSVSDKAVGIGGGNGDYSAIVLKKGEIYLMAKGINALGIGSAEGIADITIEEDVKLSIKTDGNDVVSIGTFSGRTKMVTRGDLYVLTDGECVTGIGAMKGTGEVYFESGRIICASHCNTGVCVGTMYGEVKTVLEKAFLDISGEGNSVSGVGSENGSTETYLQGGTLRMAINAAQNREFGNDKCNTVISGGNILLNRNAVVKVKNAFGFELYPVFVENEEQYEHIFSNGVSAYVYRAEKHPDVDQLCVFIPWNE